MGLELGVQRQEQDCRALAEASGWPVVQVFQENDTSAFKRREIDLPGGGRGQRVVRPEFRRLLEALQERRLDALVTYDLDRVARDPRDLEDLIDVVETRAVHVRSVTGSLRLDSDADVTMARVLVAMGNKSSRDTSRRVARRAQQRAEAGAWHGGWAPFGYEYARDDPGKIVGLKEHAERAALLREAATRVLAGETLYRVSKDFNARGLRTAPSATMPEGTRWFPATLKRCLTSPAVAGKRKYRGDLLDGQWPALLDRRLVAAAAGHPAGPAARPAQWRLPLDGPQARPLRPCQVRLLLQRPTVRHPADGAGLWRQADAGLRQRRRRVRTHPDWLPATGRPRARPPAGPPRRLSGDPGDRVVARAGDARAAAARAGQHRRETPAGAAGRLRRRAPRSRRVRPAAASAR